MPLPPKLVLGCALVTWASGCRGNTPPPSDARPVEPVAVAKAPASEPEPTEASEPEPTEPGEGSGSAEPATGSGPTEEPTEGPESLAAELARFGGDAPVLLTYDRTGLRATNGERERELVAASIDMALHDPARGLVWYVSDAQLRALDLEAPPGDPVVVVDRLPEYPSISLPNARLWMGEPRVPEYLVVRWSPRLRVKLGLTFDDVFNDDIARVIRRAKLVDRPWLEALAKRELRAIPAAIEPRKIPGAPLAPLCAEEEHPPCRFGVDWPGTSWKLYVSEYDCGDYCYWSCGLFDPDTGHTADPGDLPTPTWNPKGRAVDGPCPVAPTNATGTAMVVNGLLCRGERCTKIPGAALGFLDPGPTIDPGP